MPVKDPTTPKAIAARIEALDKDIPKASLAHTKATHTLRDLKQERTRLSSQLAQLAQDNNNGIAP